MGHSACFAALAVLTILAALAPASAQAALPTVHEVSLTPAQVAAGGSLRVPSRDPLPRFARAPRRGAQASSLRVSNFAGIGIRTNGKIVAVDPGGAYSCSGTAINTPSRSMVLTAGHCVIENGLTGRRIAFVPAYNHGRRPFGTFMVKSVYVTPQWRRSENPDYDVAALRVKPNDLGNLTDVVGARGIQISRSRFAALQIFGYPAAALGGEELRSCRAHGLGSDPFTFRFTGPPAMPASCDMAGGASGGAWIIDGQYVNGVTSYGYEGRPTQLFSSYFGPEIGAFVKQLP